MSTPRWSLGAAWPLASSLVLFWALVGGIVLMGVRRTGGEFAYALDDAYIHLAMGRNLAEAGVWGIDPSGFSGASSSPAWTLLLAGVALVGDHVLTPLWLNLLFGSLLLVVAEGGLRRLGVAPSLRLVAHALLIFAAPVGVLVVSGMEHLFQAFLALSVALLAARLLAQGAATRRERGFLLALAFLLVAVRYEDAFLVGVVAVAAFLRGWRLFSVGLLAAGAAPVLLYGAFSLAQGWPVLPTSILAKAGPLPADVTQIPWFLTFVLKQLLLAPHLLVPLVLALGVLAARARRDAWSEPDLLLSFFVGATLLHVLFARLGWFYRYEMYLLALGVVALASAARDALPPGGLRALRLPAFRVGVLLVLAFLALTSVSMRGIDAHMVAPIAMDNIHDQHLQMGAFLREYYAGETVAVNDIGAASYMGDVRVLDLWGLGDKEVAEAIRAGTFDTDAMRRLGAERNVSIAIVHEAVLAPAGGVPHEWIRQGEWTIRDNEITASATLSFYAVREGEGPRLKAALVDFAPQLPEDVRAWPT